MLNPYILMAVLYSLLAILGALDASLISFEVLDYFAGIRWLRVHFITLGIVSQTVFGALPMIVATQNQQPRPKTRWDIWATMNAGLLALLIGIPLINTAIITVGGTLVFIAVSLLIVQLVKLTPSSNERFLSGGSKFYLAGLGYLLTGIIVGTGLWQGWAGWLQIKAPLEVHIHANNFGFMSLIFAGLLIDLYPKITGRSMAWPKTLSHIFWVMNIGALGLVLGPWFDVLWLLIPGMILYLAATIVLILNVVKPLIGDDKLRTPGMLHLITAYAWLLVPLLATPLLVFELVELPMAVVEQNAPQALIYGWVLQFAYGMVPYLFRRVFQPNEPAELGGNWFSLILVHLGGIALWLSIFSPDNYGAVYGIAYGLWSVSLLPVAYELWGIVTAEEA